MILLILLILSILLILLILLTFLIWLILLIIQILLIILIQLNLLILLIVATPPLSIISDILKAPVFENISHVGSFSLFVFVFQNIASFLLQSYK